MRADPTGAVGAHPASKTTRLEYVERLCAGGFPPALRRANASRSRWFDNYLRQSLQRDAVELVKVRQRQVLADLLQRLAGITGQVLNLTRAIQDLAVERKTIEEYTRLLEDLFLIERLPPGARPFEPAPAPRPRSTSSTPASLPG